MSDTNRVSLRMVEEVTYGVTPDPCTMKAVPFTSSSDLGFTPETVVSEIIRDDRQVSDLVLVGGSTAGGFDTELAAEAQDEAIEGVMFSAWVANTSTDTGSDVALEAAKISSPADIVFNALGLSEGDWVKVSGFSNALFNRVYRVNGAPTATELPVAKDASQLESAGASVTVACGDSIINGTTSKSYTLERKYTDQTVPLYEYLRGMIPGTFSLTASSQSIVTSSVGFTGSTQEYTTTRVPNVTDANATTSGTVEVYNSSSNVGDLAIGGEQVSGANFIMEATIEIDNNLRERVAVDHLGAVSIGAGEFGVSGTLNTYFDNKSLAEAVVNNTATSFSISFSDVNGKTMVFDLPRIKYSEGTPDVSGKNEDVMLNLSYQAILDADLGYTVKITRFDT